MACRRCVRALSCGMVGVMNDNDMNENGRMVHESLAGVSENVLKLIMSPETPISEWTDESLIALRAMELANTSTSMCSVLAGVSPDQVTPILSICGLRVKMCVWLGVSRGLDVAFLNAD